MREEMYAFSTRILTLSIFISLITAGLVYFNLDGTKNPNFCD